MENPCEQIIRVDDEGPHYCKRSGKFALMYYGKPVEQLCLQHLQKACRLGLNNEYVIVDEIGRERQPEEFTK